MKQWIKNLDTIDKWFYSSIVLCMLAVILAICLDIFRTPYLRSNTELNLQSSCVVETVDPPYDAPFPWVRSIVRVSGSLDNSGVSTIKIKEYQVTLFNHKYQPVYVGVKLFPGESVDLDEMVIGLPSIQMDSTDHFPFIIDLETNIMGVPERKEESFMILGSCSLD